MNLHIVPNQAQLRYLYSRRHFRRKKAVLTCPESQDYPRCIVSSLLEGIRRTVWQEKKTVDRGGNIVFNVLTRPKRLVTSVSQRMSTTCWQKVSLKSDHKVKQLVDLQHGCLT